MKKEYASEEKMMNVIADKIGTMTKVTLLLLSMMTVMSNVAVVTTIPHLSVIFSEVPYIELLSRLMITLPSLAIALFAPLLGHFVNRFGKKYSAIIALLAFTLFGMAGLYLDSIYSILLSRFFFGLAIAIMMIVTTALIGDYFKGDERHRFMGVQSAFVSLGGIVFIIGGGYLSDIGWRYPFAIYFSGLIALLFVVKYLEEKREEYVHIREDVHLLNHNLWYIYFLAFLLMLVFYILPTQMPFLMIDVFHASGTLTGKIIGMAFVFNAVGAMTFARLKRHLSFSRIYMLGMLIVAVGFILIGMVKYVYLFFFTSMFMGFGVGILMANITAWMLSMAHHSKRVRSSGYLTSALFFGQFFSPVASHFPVKYLGIQKFFVAGGGALIVILFLIFTYLAFKEKRVARQDLNRKGEE